MCPIVRPLAIFVLVASMVAKAPTAEPGGAPNLYASSDGKPVVVFAPDAMDALEQYALGELTEHIEHMTGRKPDVLLAVKGQLPERKNVIVFGRLENNPLLRMLADQGRFRPNRDEQGLAIRIGKCSEGASPGTWLAVLSGADAHGVLYAVRDFSHYYFYREGDRAVLRPADVSYAPVIKVRQLSESGCNLFSAENPHERFGFTVHCNRDTRSAAFDKHHYLDWLSEWKINTISLLWCNYPAYDKAYADCVRYAHSRGLRVTAFYVPYRPGHERGPEPGKKQPGREVAGECPRDPEVRKWYKKHLIRLITREPKVDGICLETPEHDGTQCRCKECIKNPYSGLRILNETVAIVKKYRPDMSISFSLKQPTPNAAAARKVLEKLLPIEGPKDWYSNSYVARTHRPYWHAVYAKCGSYLRPFRNRLHSKKPMEKEIDGVYHDFHEAAKNGVIGYGFCYRFYAGKFGSYTIHDDQMMMAKYPDRRGPLSLAVIAEAAFDPFVEGEARKEKLERIQKLTIPDYPKSVLEEAMTK